METKVCATCKKTLPTTDFYKAGRTTNGKIRYSNECKNCRRQREQIRYEEQYYELAKLKVKCVHCGLGKPYLLEFHHRDQESKEFAISQWRKHSKEALLKELKNCDTLCKNCHAEFHYLQHTLGITYQEYLANY